MDLLVKCLCDGEAHGCAEVVHVADDGEVGLIDGVQQLVHRRRLVVELLTKLSIYSFKLR